MSLLSRISFTILFIFLSCYLPLLLQASIPGRLLNNKNSEFIVFIESLDGRTFGRREVTDEFQHCFEYYRLEDGELLKQFCTLQPAVIKTP